MKFSIGERKIFFTIERFVDLVILLAPLPIKNENLPMQYHYENLPMQ